MNIEKLIKELQEAKDNGATTVRIAADEEGNAYSVGILDLEIDTDDDTLLTIYPLETEPESY